MANSGLALLLATVLAVAPREGLAYNVAVLGAVGSGKSSVVNLGLRTVGVAAAPAVVGNRWTDAAVTMRISRFCAAPAAGRTAVCWYDTPGVDFCPGLAPDELGTAPPARSRELAILEAVLAGVSPATAWPPRAAAPPEPGHAPDVVVLATAAPPADARACARRLAALRAGAPRIPVVVAYTGPDDGLRSDDATTEPPVFSLNVFEGVDEESAALFSARVETFYEAAAARDDHSEPPPAGEGECAGTQPDSESSAKGSDAPPGAPPALCLLLLLLAAAAAALAAALRLPARSGGNPWGQRGLRWLAAGGVRCRWRKCATWLRAPAAERPVRLAEFLQASRPVATTVGVVAGHIRAPLHTPVHQAKQRPAPPNPPPPCHSPQQHSFPLNRHTPSLQAARADSSATFNDVYAAADDLCVELSRRLALQDDRAAPQVRSYRAGGERSCRQRNEDEKAETERKEAEALRPCEEDPLPASNGVREEHTPPARETKIFPPSPLPLTWLSAPLPAGAGRLSGGGEADLDDDSLRSAFGSNHASEASLSACDSQTRRRTLSAGPRPAGARGQLHSPFDSNPAAENAFSAADLHDLRARRYQHFACDSDAVLADTRRSFAGDPNPAADLHDLRARRYQHAACASDLAAADAVLAAADTRRHFACDSNPAADNAFSAADLHDLRARRYQHLACDSDRAAADAALAVRHFACDSNPAADNAFSAADLYDLRARRYQHLACDSLPAADNAFSAADLHDLRARRYQHFARGSDPGAACPPADARRRPAAHGASPAAEASAFPGSDAPAARQLPSGLGSTGRVDAGRVLHPTSDAFFTAHDPQGARRGLSSAFDAAADSRRRHRPVGGWADDASFGSVLSSIADVAHEPWASCAGGLDAVSEASGFIARPRVLLTPDPETESVAREDRSSAGRAVYSASAATGSSSRPPSPSGLRGRVDTLPMGAASHGRDAGASRGWQSPGASSSERDGGAACLAGPPVPSPRSRFFPAAAAAEPDSPPLRTPVARREASARVVRGISDGDSLG
ncbi:hypothetical protein DIPPA_17262 [Diplonema papillatum]|nr:hypothetical protein DIPPA_17262 [Diplonema papillatum]